MRIYIEIPNCKIGNFSTLKNLQSSYFIEFREMFRAKLEKIFLVPADTFDNVKGKFPIGFFIWNCEKNEKFQHIYSDVFDETSNFIGEKRIFSYNNEKYLNDWIRPTWNKIKDEIGYLACNSNDFQNQNGIFIEIIKKNQTSTYFKPIAISNLKESAIYFAVRHCIKANWLNDRDQFLFPNEGWQKDLEFQNDCLAFTLFNNDIQSQFGTNHWIPFTEQEVDAQAKFESAFMTDFMKGKIKPEKSQDTLFDEGQNAPQQPLIFSEEATAVFNAGRALWTYYHTHPSTSSGYGSTSSGYATSSGYVESKPYNVNASLYDIREHFQGRNDKGRMNSKSNDARYMELISELRSKLAVLADKIKPKVYEYGFLKE
jgi:hypothetical protein